MKRRTVLSLFTDVWNSFWEPTVKQKEAFGRYCHTLSAASLIGAISIIFTHTPAVEYSRAAAAVMGFWSVVLLAIGALLSKGE